MPPSFWIVVAIVVLAAVLIVLVVGAWWVALAGDTPADIEDEPATLDVQNHVGD